MTLISDNEPSTRCYLHRKVHLWPIGIGPCVRAPIERRTSRDRVHRFNECIPSRRTKSADIWWEVSIWPHVKINAQRHRLWCPRNPSHDMMLRPCQRKNQEQDRSSVPRDVLRTTLRDSTTGKVPPLLSFDKSLPQLRS